MPVRHDSYGTNLERRLTWGLFLAAGTLLVVIIVKTLLPWLLLAGLATAGFWLWHRQKLQEKALHLLFYDLIETHNGQITVLEFAMATKLPGAKARSFLDARAKEFFANFEATASGDVLYTFQLRRSDAPVSPPNNIQPVPDDRAELVLSNIELARRLHCSLMELSHKREESEFSQWSRNRDPDGCGWLYDPQWDYYRSIQ